MQRKLNYKKDSLFFI